MKCIQCKKREATVHISHIQGDVLERSDYCEKCAGPILEKLNDRGFKLGALNFPTEDALRSLTKAQLQALAFIFTCLDKARLRARRPTPHVEAADILRVAGPVAREMFGANAKAKLKKMGVDSSSDLGALIFDFIRRGVLTRAPGERVEDFDVWSEIDDIVAEG